MAGDEEEERTEGEHVAPEKEPWQRPSGFVLPGHIRVKAVR